jgi:hypothetical protein
LLFDSFNTHSSNVSTPSVFDCFVFNIDVLALRLIFLFSSVDHVFFVISAHVDIVKFLHALGNILVLLFSLSLLLGIFRLNLVVCGLLKCIKFLFELLNDFGQHFFVLIL